MNRTGLILAVVAMTSRNIFVIMTVIGADRAVEITGCPAVP